MNFLLYIIVFFISFYISDGLLCSSILSEFPGFTPDEVVTAAWVHFTIFTILYFSWNLISSSGLNFWTESICSLVLYINGVYRSLLSNLWATVKLVFKNLSLSIHYVRYNVSGYINFLPISQTWSPLFRRGGYLSFLNSSRARWQLTKSNSLFKNK